MTQGEGWEETQDREEVGTGEQELHTVAGERELHDRNGDHFGNGDVWRLPRGETVALDTVEGIADEGIGIIDDVGGRKVDETLQHAFHVRSRLRAGFGRVFLRTLEHRIQLLRIGEVPLDMLQLLRCTHVLQSDLLHKLVRGLLEIIATVATNVIKLIGLS